MTTPNAELAYKVLDHIDAHPEQWNQGRWYGADPECGTTACFAGWAVALSGHDVTLGEQTEDGHQAWSAIDGDEDALVGVVAAEDLGITDLTEPCRLCDINCDETNPVGKALFTSYNSREDLGRLVAEIFGPRPDAAA